MKCSLGQQLTPSDVVGTIVPAGAMIRKKGETAQEALKRAVKEERELKKVTAPLIKVTKPDVIPMVVKMENPIHPGQSTGKIYVDGKITDESEVLKELVNEPKKNILEELVTLLPLGGLALLAFGL